MPLLCGAVGAAAVSRVSRCGLHPRGKALHRHGRRPILGSQQAALRVAPTLTVLPVTDPPSWTWTWTWTRPDPKSHKIVCAPRHLSHQAQPSLHSGQASPFRCRQTCRIPCMAAPDSRIQAPDRHTCVELLQGQEQLGLHRLWRLVLVLVHAVLAHAPPCTEPCMLLMLERKLGPCCELQAHA